MTVRQIDSADVRFRSFEDFFETHPDANFFQSAVFYRFIEGLSNYTPVLLITEDPLGKINGSLLAVIQKDNNKFLRYFSSGTIVRGGPLIDRASDTGNILENLLISLINITKRETVFIQFRNFTDQRDNLIVFNKFRFDFLDHQNLIIETKTKEDVWSGISESRKRQIKKSLRNGACIVQDPSPDEFYQFYLILKDLYKKKVHKPLPSWSFFQRFFDLSKNSSFGIIRLIKFQELIIGGIVCPVSLPGMIHEWYVCGKDQQYKPMGVYPSVLATWSAIDYAFSNNIRFFDFLGLGEPGKEYGVRDFKVKFGGTLVNYGRLVRINNYPLYWIASKGYLLLKFIYSGFSKMN